MNEITWTKQPFTVGLLRYIPGGKQEKYDEVVNMNIAEGTGLGYWYAYEGTPDEALFGTFLITHLASGMRIDAETKTHEETQAFIERMLQPFTWDDESVTIDWHLSAEELQSLPCWPDIQMIRRENWMMQPVFCTMPMVGFLDPIASVIDAALQSLQEDRHIQPDQVLAMEIMKKDAKANWHVETPTHQVFVDKVDLFTETSPIIPEEGNEMYVGALLLNAGFHA